MSSRRIAALEPLRRLESALLKRYVDEPDSGVAASLLESDPALVTARHTPIEVRRNLTRLLDESDAQAARTLGFTVLGA